MSEQALRLASLHVYPVKSCAGIAVEAALVVETGLEFDRAWMLVDEDGEFLSQRELPRMALVQPRLRHDDMVLRAPGMLALHVALDAVEAPMRVRVWDDTVNAYDMGDLAARWFSDYLGRRVRLVRFDPEQQRLSSRQWTGPIDAQNAFSDGYPLLVASLASLDELNRRLVARGKPPVSIARFRPNLVLDGLDAHGEDHLDEIAFAAGDATVRLKLVKPCARCPIPNIDPLTAVAGTEPGDTLAAYRADPRLGGALTFAMNAVIVEGIDRVLRVGQTGSASFAFD